MGIFLVRGIGRVSIWSLGYRVFGFFGSGVSGLRVEYLLLGLGYFYLLVRCQAVFGVGIFQVES